MDPNTIVIGGSGEISSTVHVNNLAMLEAVGSLGATGLGLCFIALGLLLFVFALQARRRAIKLFGFVPSQVRSAQWKGAFLIQVGLALPVLANWLMDRMRDAAFFN